MRIRIKVGEDVVTAVYVRNFVDDDASGVIVRIDGEYEFVEDCDVVEYVKE
jgi:hypothetical protein